MSDGHGTDNGLPRQDKSQENGSHAKQTDYFKQAELQIALGFITLQNLMRVSGSSPNTIRMWFRDHGLKTFRPGTDGLCVHVDDARAFMARRLTFSGPKRKPRRKRK